MGTRILVLAVPERYKQITLVTEQGLHSEPISIDDLAEVGGENPQSGLSLVTAEREAQLLQWPLDHDRRNHAAGELWIQAVLLLDKNIDVNLDPWGLRKKYAGDRIKQLTVAGALIMAEIDRLQVEAAKS